MTSPLQFDDPIFEQAVAAVDAGNLSALRRLVTNHPYLLTAHASGDELFSSYFNLPTLLHFVAENPIRNGTLPDNIAAVAELLTESGIPADAPTGDGGGTTLGLVCSGMVPRQAGVVAALVAVLVKHGAQPENAAVAALNHAELPAIRALLANGLAPDLRTAAAVGQIDKLAEMHQQHPEQQTAAFLYACQAGQHRAAAALLDLGADINGRSPEVRGGSVTPLHLAVSIEHLPTIHLLLSRGADVSQKDGRFNGTPVDWAKHMGLGAAQHLLRGFGHHAA